MVYALFLKSSFHGYSVAMSINAFLLSMSYLFVYRHKETEQTKPGIGRSGVEEESQETA